MSRAFDQAITHILANEGGYVNDPDDPGGETNYGISKRSYPAMDIRNMTEQGARDIYRRDYWDRCRCDELQDGVALLVFDAAVNHGPGKAIKLLQKSAGVAADGIIGRRTITVANQADVYRLMAEYTARRTSYYSRIIAQRPKSAKYSLGWMRRAASIHHDGIELEVVA